MSEHFIRPLEAEHAESAVRLLSKAFHNDPQFVHALPDPGERRQHLPRLFSVSVQNCLRHGTLWAAVTDGGRLGGVALCVPMPEALMSDEQLAEFGFDLTDPANDAILSRLEEIERPAIARLDELFAEPHLYLDQLAVAASERRQGLGMAPVQAAVDEADAAGRRLCLITGVPMNVPFYARCGLDLAAHGISANLPWWVFGTRVAAPDE